MAVAVNLLATDLLDSALPQRMGELLNRSGLGRRPSCSRSQRGWSWPT